MRNTFFVLLLFIYATFVSLLGIIGYRVASSAASLYSGLFFGMATLIAAALLVMQRKFGYYLGIFSSFVLSGFFCMRFVQTNRAMIALMAGFSILVLLLLLYEVYRFNRYR